MYMHLANMNLDEQVDKLAYRTSKANERNQQQEKLFMRSKRKFGIT